jgi:putative ABC transport system permease protein
VPTPYAHPHQWQADVLLLSLLAGGAAAVILSTLLVAGMLGGIFTQQIPQIGIMHAIGARPRTVRRIVVAEGVALAIASCLVAAGPALVLTAVLGAGLGDLFMSAPLPFRPSILAAGIWVALVVLGAALACDAAATRASRITVREALAHL